MARKRRGSVADALNAFSSTYSMTRGLMADHAVRDTAGHQAAQAEADASGGTVHQLDKGLDDVGVADYQSKNKADIDMVAGQEDAIGAMQSEINAERAVDARAIDQGNGVSTVPLAPVEAPQRTALPAAGLADASPVAAPPGLSNTQRMAQSLNPTATDGQIADIEKQTAAPAAQAPQEGYTRSEVERPKLDKQDIYLKKYAPRVGAKLTELGQPEKAKAWDEWTRSSKGAAYGESWMAGVMAAQAGDHRTAVMASVDLYNKQLPDGQYAVAVPSKDGKAYTVQLRDEKTNKVLNSFKGDGPTVAQGALGMLSPERAFTMMQAQEAKATEKQDALAKEGRDQANKIALEKVKAESGGTPSPLGKLQAERARIAAENPNDPRLREIDLAINKQTTHAPSSNTTIFSGSPIPLEGGGLGRLTKAGGAPVPIPGALDPNKAVVTKAENALTGVSKRRDPPSPDNPNPTPYFVRGGEKIPAYVRGKPNPEYAQIQANETRLREAGKVPPWERKERPGLSK